MFFYFLFSLYYLTNLDDDPATAGVHMALRYTGVVVFVVSACLWGPFTILHHEGTISPDVAMISVAVPLCAHFTLLGVHISQVLVPGTKEDCGCDVQVLAVTSFVAGLLYTALLIFDILWGSHYYFRSYINIRDEVAPNSFVAETIELGEAHI